LPLREASWARAVSARWTIEIVSLDENHGLRISSRGHEGSWPVSAIEFAQG
jgi:hypothetical protein